MFAVLTVFYEYKSYYLSCLMFIITLGSTEMAKAAGCSPELQTVSLRNSSDPTILYLPQCTKVERCSGCCSHNLLSCQPTQTEILTYKVRFIIGFSSQLKMKYSTANSSLEVKNLFIWISLFHFSLRILLQFSRIQCQPRRLDYFVGMDEFYLHF